MQRDGNRLTAMIGTDYSDHTTRRDYDQVVVNYGTLPLDDLYFELKPLSSNGGAVDYDALIAGAAAERRAQRGRARSSCSASATRSARATPMRRSMTRCGW